MGRERGGHKRLDRGARGRSAPRHVHREKPAQGRGPVLQSREQHRLGTLALAPFSSAHARVIRRQSSIKPSHRLPLTPVLLPAALHGCACTSSSRCRDEHSSGLAAAAARAVAVRSLSATLSQRPVQAPSLLHPWHVAGTCIARAHACVRWCVVRVWRALSNALERPCRCCASRHCRLDCHV